MDATVNLDAVIARYTAFTFDDSTSLPPAGIGLHTVGDLKRWLGHIASGGRPEWARHDYADRTGHDRQRVTASFDRLADLVRARQR